MGILNKYDFFIDFRVNFNLVVILFLNLFFLFLFILLILALNFNNFVLLLFLFIVVVFNFKRRSFIQDVKVGQIDQVFSLSSLFLFCLLKFKYLKTFIIKKIFLIKLTFLTKKISLGSNNWLLVYGQNIF